MRVSFDGYGFVPARPVRLATVPAAQGWIADNTSWKTGLTKIYPPGEFKGNPAQSSWLLNDDIAFIYRAHATCDNPLKVISPPSVLQSGQVLDPGAAVTIKADTTGLPKWKRIEFFDGARSLGEVHAGSAQLTAGELTAGFHVFSVLGTDVKRQKRRSAPVLIVAPTALLKRNRSASSQRP